MGKLRQLSAGSVRRATVPVTLDTYSHAIPAMHEEAAALIARLVFVVS